MNSKVLINEPQGIYMNFHVVIYELQSINI